MIDLRLPRALAAEAMGTFALVFAGCAAIMVDADNGSLGNVGVALAFGLVIMGDGLRRRPHLWGAPQSGGDTGIRAQTPLPGTHVPAYWAAQGTGAVSAAVLLRVSLGDVADVGATTPSGSQAQSFLWEVVPTATLLFVIMAVATDTRAVGEAAAIAIGGTIALASLVGGPISGASLNPARSLGPAIASVSSTRSGSISLRHLSVGQLARSPTNVRGPKASGTAGSQES